MFVLSEDAHCAKVLVVGGGEDGGREGVGWGPGREALRIRKAEAAENISQRAVRVMQMLWRVAYKNKILLRLTWRLKNKGHTHCAVFSDFGCRYLICM